MPKPPVIVAFGDSTTAEREGVTVYPDLLRKKLAERYPAVKVINAGVRGDHTERARSRFGADVLAHDPHVVIVRFGINDAAVDVWALPPAVTPRVSLSRFCDNLTFMVTTIRAYGAVPILCTPNPLAWSEQTLQLYGQPPYLPEDVDGFNVPLRVYVDTIRVLASRFATPLVDLDSAFRQYASHDDPPWQRLLLDGMHPNDAGHLLAADVLLPLLDTILADLS
jgi:lysophospholipase L1-like esterase